MRASIAARAASAIVATRDPLNERLPVRLGYFRDRPLADGQPVSVIGIDLSVSGKRALVGQAGELVDLAYMPVLRVGPPRPTAADSAFLANLLARDTAERILDGGGR
jgi:hypothetical protein